jgi:hypothetical protein
VPIFSKNTDRNQFRREKSQHQSREKKRYSGIHQPETGHCRKGEFVIDVQDKFITTKADVCTPTRISIMMGRREKPAARDRARSGGGGSSEAEWVAWHPDGQTDTHTTAFPYKEMHPNEVSIHLYLPPNQIRLQDIIVIGYPEETAEVSWSCPAGANGALHAKQNTPVIYGVFTLPSTLRCGFT